MVTRMGMLLLTTAAPKPSTGPAGRWGGNHLAHETQRTDYLTLSRKSVLTPAWAAFATERGFRVSKR